MNVRQGGGSIHLTRVQVVKLEPEEVKDSWCLPTQGFAGRLVTLACFCLLKL
jgi:hypothetical protein